MKNEKTVLYQLTETSEYMVGYVIVTRENNVIVYDGGRPEDMPLLKTSDVIGSVAAVYIKSIIPERMKIKLVLIDLYRGDMSAPSLKYFISSGSVEHIDKWRYSPKESSKVIETVFE